MDNTTNTTEIYTNEEIKKLFADDFFRGEVQDIAEKLIREMTISSPKRKFVMSTPKGDLKFTLPPSKDVRDDLIVTYPFSYEDFKKIIAEYIERSPFFKNLFKEVELDSGPDKMMELVNSYARIVQHKRGTLNYYSNWFFGTARSRNSLVAFLEDREVIPIAHADVQNAVTQEQNTTFTDQRSIVADEGYVTTQTQPDMQGVSMQENTWHVQEVMNKPIPFYHSDWAVSQSQGTILKQWNIPGDTLFGPHYNQVATFTYFRGHPTVRFQINGTKFHSGRLLAVFIPGFQFANYDDKLYDIDTLLTCPHVILDAGFSNSGVINLPFVHMNTYFNTVQGSRGWQSLGRLILVVFNRLGSATTSSQSVGVTGWISYDKCELHQPCYAHTVNLPKSGTAEKTIIAHAAVEGLVKSMVPMITDLVAPGMGSLAEAGVNMIGSVAGGTSNLDKPTDPVEISRWVPNAVTSLSQGTGLDKSSRLCLENGSYTIGNADIISTTEDDMNLLEVCKIPTRFATFKWESSTGTGTSLAKIPVCPNIYNRSVTNEKVKPAVDIITPTLLSYISRGFKFWNGSLNYKVQIVASQMHSGRLMIAYASGITDLNFDGASYLNTYIIDLQERHEVEFVIPFLAERPWLRCDRMRKVDVPSTMEVGHDNFENSGYLVIYILNRLSKPDSVAASVDINVLVSAGEDFQLAVPADFTAFQGIGDVVDLTVSMAETRIAHAMVGQEPVSSRTETGIVTLTKGGSTLSETAKSTLSENAMDLKTLLRRYYKVYTNKIDLRGTTNTVTFANTPTLSGVNKCFNGKLGKQNRTHLCHFSELFTFWRGSLRYKMIFTTQKAGTTYNIRVFHIPGAFVFGNFSPRTVDDNVDCLVNACESYGTLLAETNVQSSLEFEIPFYTPYTQLRTIADVPNARTSTGLIMVVIDGTSTSAENSLMNLSLYQAAGDDFALNYLRAAPRIQFVKGAEANREVDDIGPFIYQIPKIPIICPAAATVEVAEEGEPRPIAHAWHDGIPVVGDAMNAVKSVTGAGRAIEEVCDTTGHLIQQAKTKLGLGEATGEDDDEVLIGTSVLEKVESFTDPIVAMFETLKEYIACIPNLMGLSQEIDTYTTIIDIASLVSSFNSFTNGGPIIKACAIVSMIQTILGSISTIAKNTLYRFAVSIISNVNGCKKGNEQPVAQADFLDFAAPLTATLSIAVGLLGFKSIPDDKETMNIVETISKKLRLFNFSSVAMSNIKGLWLQIKELFEWVTELILSYYNPTYLAQLKLRKEFEKVEEWACFIDELDNIQYEDRIHWDPEFRRRVYRAIDLGKKYNGLLITGKIGREGSVVREYCRKITEIAHKCEGSKNGLPFRKDPFCISMYGKTGVGKSGCITALGFDIMDELEYPLQNRWCPVNCAEKFFTENYKQQFAVYFDDFSALTTEEQYQKFFNLKANTAFPLDMAFRKGEYFNSDFIFMTTNTSHPQPNCITCMPALWRRRDVLIEADFVDEVRARGEAGEFVMEDDYSHARFRLANPRVENEFLTDWMTFQEMRTVIAEKARVHHRRQEEKLNRDLTRAGYIVPEAQSGVKRTIVLKGNHALSMFDEELWSCLEYNEDMEMFNIKGDAPEEMREEWNIAVQHYIALEDPDFLQDYLKRNSTVSMTKKTLVSKITGSMMSLKNSVWEKVKAIYERLPNLKVLFSAGIKIAVALFAIKMVAKGLTAIVHTCACVGLQYFGYRCGFCGKWPNMKNSSHPDWLAGEWRSLYGTREYVDGHHTTIEEESLIKSTMAGKTTSTGIDAGTHKRFAQGGPYSDITKGSCTTRIIAQNSPYNLETAGTKTARIMAHSDKQVTDLISNRILQCLYRIRITEHNILPPISLQAFAIGGRQLMTTSHFFMGLKDGDYFEIFHSNQWMQIEFLRERAHELEGKDIIIYDMPIQFHQHKSNINHFVSERELEYARTVPITLCKINNQLQNVLMESSATSVDTISYDFIPLDKRIRIQNAWRYNLHMNPGDCGAPILAHSNKLSGKILGVHVCGSTSEGWSTLVTREMIEKFVETHLGSGIPQAHAKLGNIIPQGHFGRIGKCKEGTFFQGAKTEIIPTTIHGEISAPVTFPTVLSRNDERLEKRVNPLEKGISKYGQVLRPFPMRNRKIVNEFLRSELHTYTRLRRPEILTDQEAVAGVAGFDNAFEPLPMNTSPGWPYVNTRPRGESGKAYLFDEARNIKDRELQKRLAERETLAKRGERVESIWIDCMKDERRAMEKIVTGNTRLFAIGPVDFSILCRKYTLDFVESIKASRGFSHCKLGIDPQSLEWTQLHNYFAGFANNMVAGDFSRFDGTIHGDMIEDFYGDVDYFYKTFGSWSEEDAAVRRVLADETCNTIHLAKDELYMTHCGNPSGNPQTTPLNSRSNFRYMALAWLEICELLEKWEYATMEKFSQHVRLGIFGDDNLLAITDEVIDWYNQESISAVLEKYNITYTNATKTGVTKSLPISECTFLKQRFADHKECKNIKVPLMNENTINELLNWTRISPDADALLKDNCNDALRFCYFYGEEYFNAKRKKIEEALEKHGKRFRLMTYLDLHLWFLAVCGMRGKN